MTRMTAQQIKGLEIDARVSITERTATAKALIKEAAESLEDQFAAQVERYGLPTPVPQFMFEDTAQAWRYDFAWPQYKLVVEVNGGIYQNPPTGHRSIRGLLRDYSKINAATARHWWSIIIEPKEIESGAGVLMVQDFILEFERLSGQE